MYTIQSYPGRLSWRGNRANPPNTRLCLRIGRRSRSEHSRSYRHIWKSPANLCSGKKSPHSYVVQSCTHQRSCSLDSDRTFCPSQQSQSDIYTGMIQVCRRNVHGCYNVASGVNIRWRSRTQSVSSSNRFPDTCSRSDQSSRNRFGCLCTDAARPRIRWHWRRCDL